MLGTYHIAGVALDAHVADPEFFHCDGFLPEDSNEWSGWDWRPGDHYTLSLVNMKEPGPLVERLCGALAELADYHRPRRVTFLLENPESYFHVQSLLKVAVARYV